MAVMFLPISSTGHLILARHLLGLPLVGTISFDAIIQLATGIALVCYFWKDIFNIISLKYKHLILPLIIGTIPAVILGLFLGILSQIGDLSESLIKRDCQVKDSGLYLPGFGGILDVIDSLLFTTPIFYFYVRMFL